MKGENNSKEISSKGLHRYNLKLVTPLVRNTSSRRLSVMRTNDNHSVWQTINAKKDYTSAIIISLFVGFLKKKKGNISKKVLNIICAI